MGRHSRSSHAPRHAAVADAGAANYVGRIGALALALGIGAAVAGGAGVANAEGATGTDGPASGSSSQSSTKTSETTKTTKGAGEASTGGTAAADSPESPDTESTRPPTRKPGFGNGRENKHSSPSATVGGTTGAVKPAEKPAVKPAADDETAPVKEAPATTAVTGSPEVSKSTSATHTGDAPVAPGQVVLGALQLIRREIEGATSSVKPAAAVTGRTELVQPNAAAPVVAPSVPSPTDVAHTVYGDIGAWLLQPNGNIANYGGVQHGGKTVLEPVNVIILDPTSTSAAESAARLDAAMTRAGFPAQPIHSTGFSGIINGAVYGQKPTGFLQAFSDNFFLFPNDHGRMFGAAPAANGAGYVWSGAFSTEQLNPANPFTHEYVSSDNARAELARRLVASGAATVVGVVPLGNAYDDGTFTTGDHDGYAVVLQLTPGVVAVLPMGGVLGSACGHVDDLPGPVGRQLATGLCVVAAQVSTALGLRSVI